MLIKLALYDDKKIINDIVECCKKNNAHYLPVFDNKFGILTEDVDVTYGREDGTYSYDVNPKTFVKIYKCVLDSQKQGMPIFGKKAMSPYNGKMLDNLFFKNVISYCEKNNIEVEFLRIISHLRTDITVYEPEEIKEVLDEKDDTIIERLSLILKGNNIVLSRHGYVNIALDCDSYKENENLIIGILKVGFKD